MQVNNITTLLDGGALMEISLSYEETVALAKVGILETLMEATRAYQIVEGEVVDG